MRLPLVKRGTAGSNSLPTSDSLYKCMEVATKPDSARYFHTQFEQRLIDAGLKDKSGPVLNEVKKFADYIALQGSNSNPWSGDIHIPSAFHNYQEHLAKEAIKEVAVNNIDFDYAVSNQSEFLRGYSNNGQPVDGETLSSMDKIFNAWLVENDMLCNNGVIYEATAKGDIKLDSKGEPVKADPERLKSLLHHKDKGFEQYLHKKDEAIQVNVREQAYPEKRVVAEKGPEARV
ncbi:hypothetical protein [Legionella londiniensis]|uniref:Substrate of the Dot/Icm secretion system n=1 Tax=Legionella londiniensis TaxID=45068 RepID=A0A0W0VIJ0_9GAMM|nr:hypothetical protein [Legionella londiniensis]KTD19938.1 substrate of the Dot/Icm secretion system [Legionella londiniensis]STX94189.1 Dot/Icm secretion system substrate [Legionella londiniensis]